MGQSSEPATAMSEKPSSLTTVVAASSAGTAFEYYDFLLFGSLTPILSQRFFSGVDETTGFFLALATFGAGFAARPFGGLVFGSIGDRRGRKGAFLSTIVMMGIATLAIGFLPTYEQVGVLAPLMLVGLRLIQGFALGGEYGGAAIYVAEHAPAARRGEMTGWIQTAAAFGLMGALLVILATRSVLGEEAFAAWGWRIPFLVSALLLGVSIWMRTRLRESPVFRSMSAAGQASHAPLRETLGRWSNLKLVLLAFFGMMAGQGAVWYAGFFYAQFFLERVLKAPPPMVNLFLLAAAAVSAVLYLVFAWISDRIGRKPVMIFGMVVAVAGFLPGFHTLTRAANPALDKAIAAAPVTVFADPAGCSLQFDLLGRRKNTQGCDIAKAALMRAGVPYASKPAAPGVVVVQVGRRSLSIPESGADAATTQAALAAALAAQGYPKAADPARIDVPAVLGVLMIFVVAATALYGPLAAALVELFPARIRYTALALPFHIGSGWIGGFLPATAFAITAATGDLYAGLWYPVGFAALSLVVSLLFLPETRGRMLGHETPTDRQADSAKEAEAKPAGSGKVDAVPR